MRGLGGTTVQSRWEGNGSLRLYSHFDLSLFYIAVLIYITSFKYRFRPVCQSLKNTLLYTTPTTPLPLQVEVERREHLLEGLGIPHLFLPALPAVLPVSPLLQSEQLAHNTTAELQVEPESGVQW